MDALVVGIDVSKDRLDVAVRPTGESFVFKRTAAGIEDLVARLKARSPTLVAIEATGGFEAVVAAGLAGAGLPVVVVNPAQVRAFARALGKRAKTDPIDAVVIAHFAEATKPPEVKMNGSDCVTVLGARWLSPASDPKVLAQVECWPAVLVAHFATSRGVALEEWWGAGTAPLLAIQGLDDEIAPPGNGHALREQMGERVRLMDLPRAGHFMLLEQPEAVTRAVAAFIGAGTPLTTTMSENGEISDDDVRNWPE